MKKIALFLSILFLASSVFSQGLLTFRQLNGDTFHLNIADIQLAFIYNGSSTKLIKSGKAGSIYTLDSLGYLKDNSCNSFIDVNVNPNGARLLISKNHIDNVLKFRNGARIILPDGSQVTTTTLWADVIAQTSVPVGCGAGVDSTGNVDHGNILYVATTGDNATAVKGNPHKPYANPFYAASILGNNHTIKAFNGVYDFGIDPVFNPSDINSSSLMKWDSITIDADPSVTFRSLNTPSSGVILSDISTFINANKGKKVFRLNGFPQFIITNAVNSIRAPFTMYNYESIVDLNIDKFSHLGGGRNWFMQAGIKKLTANIKEVEISGGIVFSIFNSYDSTTIKSGNERHYNMSFGEVIADGKSDAFGIFRYQNDAGSDVTTDSLSNFTINVNNVNLRNSLGKTGMLLFDAGDNFTKQSLFSFKFKKVTSPISPSAVINNYGVQLPPSPANQSNSEILFFSNKMSGSQIHIDIEDIDTKSCLFGQSTDQSVFDSTLIHIKINKGVFREGPMFSLSSFSLRNNSKLIIECNDCRTIGNTSAFWISANQVDSTSVIEIRGRYKVSGSNAVVNTNSPVVLNNAVLINAGTIAPVQATSAVNITTYNTYTNSTGTDLDVTYRVTPVIYDPYVK